MVQTILSILVGLGSRLVTEKVIKEVTLILLEKLVKSTKNELDDELFKPVAEELRK